MASPPRNPLVPELSSQPSEPTLHRRAPPHWPIMQDTWQYHIRPCRSAALSLSPPRRSRQKQVSKAKSRVSIPSSSTAIRQKHPP
ncbi:hypothetical protein B0T18DRAFT_409144 [Schizothecium vesticola]|uniref:Uncharacterized protein n=1 Tax=Schizothecium vesticola TaxID=314040 RepID=A0AA40K9A5_9PEZI|nr:hypothetical protein B0T18DRAFT_409144 [Schizothecium vesticola]